MLLFAIISMISRFPLRVNRSKILLTLHENTKLIMKTVICQYSTYLETDEQTNRLSTLVSNNPYIFSSIRQNITNASIIRSGKADINISTTADKDLPNVPGK